MDLSGVIFVVLALAWAGVLVPKLLHHHDEAARTRAVDRFSPATRVLARREPAAGASGREARLVVTPGKGATRDPAAQPAPSPRTAAHRTAARAAARRRRRILLLLVLALAGIGAAAYVAALPTWSVAVPAGLTVAYLAFCRVLVRREHRAWHRLARPAAAAASPRVADGVAARVEAAEPLEAPAQSEEARNTQGFAEVSAHEDTVSLPREDLAAAGAGSLWDPLPITLPTYVGKPKARRTVRTIDLAERGVSSSGHDATESERVADQAAQAEVEPPRAVGS